VIDARGRRVRQRYAFFIRCSAVGAADEFLLQAELRPACFAMSEKPCGSERSGALLAHGAAHSFC